MRVKEFLSAFIDRFSEERTTTLASSLAYYTALSLAPLIVLFVTLSSKLSDDLQNVFLVQVQNVVGPDAARAFNIVIENAKERPDLASISGLFGALTLLLSASLIFGELRAALNQIFKTQPKKPTSTSKFSAVYHFIKAKILTAGLALGFILLIIASLVASSVMTATFGSYQKLWSTLNIIISLVSYVGLFTLLFHFMPAQHIRWKRAFQGGLITASLFVVGKELLGIYLGRSALGSAYGAAGSLIVLLVWVYYSTLITFIGAHVSSLLLWKDSHA
jgi:membrane protein